MPDKSGQGRANKTEGRTCTIVCSGNRDEFVLNSKFFHDGPDTAGHADTSADLSKLSGGLVDIEVHVRRVLLEAESEDQASHPRAAGKSINMLGVVSQWTS